MATVDLSIAIASYNTVEYTRQTLQSVYDSTEGISFEVIVIDNASSDGSPEMVRSEFPEVKLICNSENVGVAAATNQGIEVSQGRYFITMNSDVIVQPEALKRLVAFMDAHPDAGAATAKLVLPDGFDHPPVCGNPPTFRSEMLDALSMFGPKVAAAAKRARFYPPIDYSKTQEVPCVLWGTAYVVRREVLDTVGGQDPRYFVYCEDTDWSMRIAKAGWKQYFVSDAVIVHLGGRSTGWDSPRATELLTTSRCRRMRKHGGVCAGAVYRLTIASLSAIRFVRWIFRKSSPEYSRTMDELRRVIRAALTC